MDANEAAAATIAPAAGGASTLVPGASALQKARETLAKYFPNLSQGVIGSASNEAEILANIFPSLAGDACQYDVHCRDGAALTGEIERVRALRAVTGTRLRYFGQSPAMGLMFGNPDFINELREYLSSSRQGIVSFLNIRSSSDDPSAKAKAFKLIAKAYLDELEPLGQLLDRSVQSIRIWTVNAVNSMDTQALARLGTLYVIRPPPGWPVPGSAEDDEDGAGAGGGADADDAGGMETDNGAAGGGDDDEEDDDTPQAAAEAGAETGDGLDLNGTSGGVDAIVNGDGGNLANDAAGEDGNGAGAGAPPVPGRTGDVEEEEMEEEEEATDQLGGQNGGGNNGTDMVREVENVRAELEALKNDTDRQVENICGGMEALKNDMVREVDSIWTELQAAKTDRDVIWKRLKTMEKMVADLGETFNNFRQRQETQYLYLEKKFNKVQDAVTNQQNRED